MLPAYSDKVKSVKLTKSVKQYSYVEEPNHKYRKEMEDRIACYDSFNSNPNQGIFCVFDGHGGEAAAEYCSYRIQEELKSTLKSADCVQNALIQSFKNLESQLKLEDTDTTGTTACVTFITLEKTERILYVANVGDSRAIMSSAGKPKRISVDHKCSDESEIARVASCGVKIENGRLGGLAITRSLGDFRSKTASKNTIICEPFVNRIVLKPTDKWLVVASDGLYDNLTDQEIIACIDGETESDMATKKAVKLALDKGAQDNISIVIVKLN